ncbi:MAG TPA: hypothetical protein DCG53_03250 [Syntrophus sp. (in: bacteria)]|nr:hypothetical protein [Syntrophus sp. (in: bacteria)]
MSTLELTREEERHLLEILERYYPSLRIEVVNTDDREFRRALKQRETFMKDLITRLKAALDA